MKWALIDNETNEVLNIIVYNGIDSYSPPAGQRLEEVSDELNIGDVLSSE